MLGELLTFKKWNVKVGNFNSTITAMGVLFFFLHPGLTYDIQAVTTMTEEEMVVVTTEASKSGGAGADQAMAITPENINKKKKKQQEVSYSCNVTVDGELFTGTGKSQKVAKQEACKYALLKKFNILYVPGVC